MQFDPCPFLWGYSCLWIFWLRYWCYGTWSHWRGQVVCSAAVDISGWCGWIWRWCSLNLVWMITRLSTVHFSSLAGDSVCA
jgi:hypothetical protein